MRNGTHLFVLRVLGCVALSASSLLLPSLAWASGKKKAAASVDISKLVWPQPPDQMRIRYLGEYFGEFDLLPRKQAKGGILERLAGVSVSPEERPRMIKPYGVAVDSKGRIYVADSAQNKVFVFDLENRTLDFRGDQAPAHIEIPIGVAVDRQDRLFVSDSKLHQITCFGPNGDVQSVFGAGDLRRPAGLAIDGPLNRLYVADAGGKRIAIFDLSSLKLISYFGNGKNGGDPVGVLSFPNGIAVDPDGLVYVTDAIVGRVVVYDIEGNFVRTWGGRGDGPSLFGRPKGIAADSDGHIYVADSQLNIVQIYSPEGKPLLAFSGPGPGQGQFMLMAGLAMDRQNRLIAVDQSPARIELFHYVTDAEADTEKSGKAKTSSGDSTPKHKPVEPAQAPQAEPAPVAAQPAAPPGPTIEELQKQLEELKAKLAVQEQQQKPEEQEPDAAQPLPSDAKNPVPGAPILAK